MSVTSRCIWLALAVSLAAWTPELRAQEETEVQPQAEQKRQRPQVRRVVRVEHQSAKQLATMVSGIVRIKFDSRLQAIVLSGDEETVNEAQAIIESLDEPRESRQPDRPENVELTFHLIGVVREGGDDFSGSRLAPVIEQLRAQFDHEGYRLLDSPLLRGRDGRKLRLRGSLAEGASADGSRISYKLEAEAEPVHRDGRDEVFFQSLFVELQKWTDQGVVDLAQMDTRLAVPVDKLVVIGKAGVDDPLIEGLFVVLSARVVE